MHSRLVQFYSLCFGFVGFSVHADVCFAPRQVALGWALITINCLSSACVCVSVVVVVFLCVGVCVCVDWTFALQLCKFYVSFSICAADSGLGHCFMKCVE